MLAVVALERGPEAVAAELDRVGGGGDRLPVLERPERRLLRPELSLGRREAPPEPRVLEFKLRDALVERRRATRHAEPRRARRARRRQERRRDGG